MNRCIKKFYISISFAASLLLLAANGLQAEPNKKTGQPREADPDDVSVPKGYRVDVVAQGLDYLSDITFGPNGEIYLAVVGGHTYGTSYKKAPPASILQILPNGETKTIVGPDKVLPLDVIRNAEATEYIEINGRPVPTAYDLPEGIIMPVTGVTYHDGKLYISHRARISTYDLETGELNTIVDNLPSWGEFLNTKPKFHEDKMYFTQASQGNLGPIDSHWMKVITALDKPLAREVPCEDVTLQGRDFWVRNGFTKDPHDAELSGVYVPFGFETTEGQVIEGQHKCNGAMYRAEPDGSNLEVIAWGLRSNFGYDFSPSGRLVITQNSCNPIPPRKVFDDYEPVYEIEEGAWYGWPEYCSSIPITDQRFRLPEDTDYKGKPSRLSFVLTDETRERLLDGRTEPPEPLALLPVHSAAEGMVFGREDFGMDPENEILVAEMGNIVPFRRDEQPGFRVQKVNLQTGEYSDFMTNKGGGPASVVGNKGLERPLQLAWGPDGALYVVDFGIINITKKGMNAQPNSAVVWKVTHTGNTRMATVEPIVTKDLDDLYAQWAGEDEELTIEEWDRAIDERFGEDPVNLSAELWDDDGNGIVSIEEFEEAVFRVGMVQMEK